MDPFLFSFEWGDRKCSLKYRFEFSSKFRSKILKAEEACLFEKERFLRLIFRIFPAFNVFNFSRTTQQYGQILFPTEIYETFRFTKIFFYLYARQISMQTSKESKLGDTDLKYRDDYFSPRSSGKR